MMLLTIAPAAVFAEDVSLQDGTITITLNVNNEDAHFADSLEPELTLEMSEGDWFECPLYVPVYEGSEKLAFAGWSTDENATEPEYLPTKVYFDLTESMTLYGVWQEAINVTSNTGDGGYYTDDSDNQVYSKTFTVPKGSTVMNLKLPINYARKVCHYSFSYEQDGELIPADTVLLE